MASFDDQMDDRPLRKGRQGRWPKLPEPGAELGEIRTYLTDAARLPHGWIVESAERHGRYEGDPLTITLRGPVGRVSMRFRNQRDASKPAALRGALLEVTGGVARMPYPKTAEASDFYAMICALATVTDESTVADETRAWVAEYAERADVLTGHTLVGEGRYDALQAMRERKEFTRVEAIRWTREDLPPGARWVLFVDEQTGSQFIRTGEFATYVRHVIGAGRMSQHALDALMAEIGSERGYWEVNRSAAGFAHPKLLLYRLPTDPAFPTVYAREDDENHARALLRNESQGRWEQTALGEDDNGGEP